NRRYLRARQLAIADYRREILVKAQLAKMKRGLKKMFSNVQLVTGSNPNYGQMSAAGASMSASGVFGGGGALGIPGIDVDELEVGSAKRLFVERQQAGSRRLLDEADLLFVAGEQTNNNRRDASSSSPAPPPGMTAGLSASNLSHTSTMSGPGLRYDTTPSAT